MRKPFVCGNWKMYTLPRDAGSLAGAIAAGLPGEAADVAVCPPFPSIPAVAGALRGTPVAWGGQNCAARREGALTGEVSAPMLVDLDCRYVILGHSERRQHFGETDGVVHGKLVAALESGLWPVLCVGETLKEREAGRTEDVVDAQVRGALGDIPLSRFRGSVIAYEPVWAIGTGRTATPDQAEAMHRRIRVTLSGVYGEETAVATRVLYGGSVKPGNAGELFSQPNIDGGLIGGASLQAADFLAIVEAACSTG